MFDFVCEKEGCGREERERVNLRNNGVNGVCTYAGATRARGVATRRVVADGQTNGRTDGQTDGDAAGNYVARTERPRNRNSCRLSLSLSVIPSGYQGPDVLLPVHLRTSVSHLSPPYPAFNGWSFAASCSRFRETDGHASGRIQTRHNIVVNRANTGSDPVYCTNHNFFGQFRNCLSSHDKYVRDHGLYFVLGLRVHLKHYQIIQLL